MNERSRAGAEEPTWPLVSIVIPALDEAANVPELLARYREFAAAQPRYGFELVVIDDGSTDGTADLVLEHATAEDRATVIRLARSFGSHYAISAGFAHCSGDCAVVLGADLQEPPSLLTDFLAHWERGVEVVWGVRRSRVRRGLLLELGSRSFSLLFSRFANLANYPPEGPSGVLLDRCVIDEVGRMPEHNRNVLALIAWLGFTQTRVDYEQLERRHGTSRWTPRKMVKLAVDSMLQFSSLPLRLFTFTGLAVAAIGLLYAAVLVLRGLAGVETPSGWPTVIVIILVLGGMQLSVMGIMGEYLWRAVEETRRRPLYVVRDVRRVGVTHAQSPQSPRRGRRPAAAATRIPAAGSTLSRIDGE